MESAGASFQQACERAGIHSGTVAIIGGPSVFAMFFGRYDTFWLSQAPLVHLPDGIAVFPGVPQRSPEETLQASGCKRVTSGFSMRNSTSPSPHGEGRVISAPTVKVFRNSLL